jgi:hypothetical protein
VAGREEGLNNFAPLEFSIFSSFGSPLLKDCQILVPIISGPRLNNYQNTCVGVLGSSLSSVASNEWVWMQVSEVFALPFLISFLSSNTTRCNFAWYRRFPMI